MSSAASSAEQHPGSGPVIALVAGEASGDQLGAALIEALLETYPNARFIGVGGPKMTAMGMECWRSSEELAVMGLFEVLAHLPRLLRLRRWLAAELRRQQPDILIGIDAPDFNLGLERKARAAGIRTAHYVSPTVWAWRSGRVHKIARSTDMMLCLFPFEPAFYARHDVSAHYTGHPLADSIPPFMEASSARAELGIPLEGPCIGLLPGSRRGEVSRLAAPMLESARILSRRYPTAHFVAPMASKRVRETFEQALQDYPGLPITLVDEQARQALAASDVVACASGTAALEAMLVNRPMVVVYRLNQLTYLVGRVFRLVKSRFFSLPNILADQPLVPELLQHEASPGRIADEVGRWLEEPARVRTVRERFSEMHRELRCDAARSAARCIASELRHGVQ
jgi:lipid-A-disaccharide synthase